MPTDPVLIAIINTAGVIIAASAALFAAILGLRNAAKLHNIHIDINSRFSQLLESERARARAEGVIEGSAQEPSAEATKARTIADIAGQLAHDITTKDAREQ